MSEILTLDEPRAIAAKITSWHLLDLNLVHKQGFMRVGSTFPCGKTGELIRWGVLKYAPDTGLGNLLTPTRLFLRVCKAALDRQSGQAA